MVDLTVLYCPDTGGGTAAIPSETRCCKSLANELVS